MKAYIEDTLFMSSPPACRQAGAGGDPVRKGLNFLYESIY